MKHLFKYYELQMFRKVYLTSSISHWQPEPTQTLLMQVAMMSRTRSYDNPIQYMCVQFQQKTLKEFFLLHQSVDTFIINPCNPPML